MKKLHLNLKRKWFDMILSGEKKEEYREIKDSMVSKFINWQKTGATRGYFTEMIKLYGFGAFFYPERDVKKYDTIIFSNGYKKDRPQFEIELKSIKIGYGNPEWGAEKDKLYFVLELGERKDK
jgi:hypothetical protein